jgi:hypothetical protein
MRPVLSKAKHTRSHQATDEGWRRLVAKGERVWLFRPQLSVLSHPAVVRYLSLAEKDGGCRKNAYKVTSREPWYDTALPRRPDGFVSGMTQIGPWVCINEMDRLSATNTLYTIRFRKSLPRDEKYAWALMLLTSVVRRQVRSATREYALGLSKLEPGDLAGLWLPSPRVVAEMDHIYRDTLESLLSGDAERAGAAADKYVRVRGRDVESTSARRVQSRR